MAGCIQSIAGHTDVTKVSY